MRECAHSVFPLACRQDLVELRRSVNEVNHFMSTLEQAIFISPSGHSTVGAMKALLPRVIEIRSRWTLASGTASAYLAMQTFLEHPDADVALGHLNAGIRDLQGNKVDGPGFASQVEKCVSVLLMSIVSSGGNFAEDRKTTRPKIDSALGIVSRTGAPTDMLTRAIAMLPMCSEACGMVQDMDRLQGLGDAHAQAAAELGESAWSAMAVAIDAVSGRRADCEELYNGAGGEEAQIWVAVKTQVDEVLEKAGAVKLIFAEAKSALHRDFIQQKLTNLRGIYKGMVDGTSWRSSLSDDSPLDGVLAHAAGTIAKQRGLKSRIERAISELRSALHDGGEISKRYSQPQDQSLLTECAQAIHIAQATMVEGIFVQLFKGSGAEVSPPNRGRLREEADFLAPQAVSTRLIHPALWEKVQSVLASE